MGIDISHSLLVGCSYDELEDFIAKEVERFGGEGEDMEPCEILDDYFEQASPYYDADREICFYGFRIPNNHEINEQWWEVVLETAYQFELLTGVKARIRGGAHVY